MTRSFNRSFFAFALTIISLLAQGAAARPSPLARPIANVKPVIYRLDDASVYAQGCFPPCYCPIWETGMRGTFGLRLTEIGQWSATYDVTDVNFFVDLDGADPDLHITGSGTFTIGGDFAYLQRMELDLAFSDGSEQHFDSGWVEVSGSFPGIVISLSANGMVCHDTVLGISAKPVRKSQIKPYKLLDDSTYQQGCFLNCECLLEMPRLMAGSFALVPLVETSTYAEYAVVNVAWKVPGLSASGTHTLSGSGHYVVIQGFAGPIDQMETWLSVDGGGPTRFDSGLNNASAFFPEILTTMTMNDYQCFDIALTVHAKPVN